MCSKRWNQAYSQLLQLFNIAELSERKLYLDFCTCSKLCTDYLISLWYFLILTQAELKVLTDPSCFIDLSPALTTSITRLSLVQFLYGTPTTSLTCVSYVPNFRSNVWMHITY